MSNSCHLWGHTGSQGNQEWSLFKSLAYLLTWRAMDTMFSTHAKWALTRQTTC